MATRGQERLAGLLQELETAEDVAPEVVAAVEEIELRLPDETFESSRDLGGCELVTFGGGHTESDAVLLVPAARVLFAADLVVVRSHGWVGDGNVESWLEILERIRGLDFDVLVPGHGPVGSRADVDAMADYLGDLLEAAREHRPHAPLPERYREWAFADGWARNLAELTS